MPKTADTKKKAGLVQSRFHRQKIITIWDRLCVQLCEDVAQRFALAQLLQREFRMAFRIAIAHDHVHIAADALSTETSFCELVAMEKK